MTSPTQTEPPFVPLRHHGWASKRTPWWIFVVLVVLVAVVVVTSLSVKPSKSGLASDMVGYLQDVQGGVGSCAAGLGNSESAYDQINAGKQVLNKNAESVFTYGSSNCTVESNEALNDFGNYQVAQSLDSYNLDTADNDVITWAFDAVAAQNDMLAVLQTTTPAAKASSLVKLKAALLTLDNERAVIDKIWTAARTATKASEPLPDLPTWMPPATA
jgi:hypothetical protein